MIAEWIFWFCAFLVLVGGALVVWNPITEDPVVRALMFGISMVGVAGLFTLLGCEFLGFAHLFVYVGALVVIMVFMLMFGTRDEERKFRFSVPLRVWVGFLAGGIIVVCLVWLMKVLFRCVEDHCEATKISPAEIVLVLLDRHFVILPLVGVMGLLGVAGVLLYAGSDDE
jgi:NADH-quinone oxidoreductase subunit J